jgi:two-component system chemotaxis response regulator CheB
MGVNMTATRKVLLVGRDPALQGLLQRNLAERGYRLLTTEVYGAELKSVLRDDLPDLVMLDAMMPLLLGSDVALCLRQWSSVPVIMLTAWAAGKDRVRGLDPSEGGFLTEPFGVDELMAQMEEAMQRAGGCREPVSKRSTSIVVLGSSTGGPKALAGIFSGLPRLSASMILVQHMPRLINEWVRRSLDEVTDMEVKVAEDGEVLEDGKVYLAPSELDLEIVDNRRLRLSRGASLSCFCPAIDVAMKSLKGVPGDNVAGVVLTGMGRDGAEGIRHVKRIGGTTIAQNEETATVSGMPKAAVATGMVDYILSPEEIRSRLMQMAS